MSPILSIGHGQRMQWSGFGWMLCRVQVIVTRQGHSRNIAEFGSRVVRSLTERSPSMIVSLSHKSLQRTPSHNPQVNSGILMMVCCKALDGATCLQSTHHTHCGDADNVQWALWGLGKQQTVARKMLSTAGLRGGQTCCAMSSKNLNDSHIVCCNTPQTVCPTLRITDHRGLSACVLLC